MGPWNDRYAWEKKYQEDFIEKHGIKFIDYDWVEDINEWYDDKGIILSTSKKEGFGYSIAEGMAKGAYPVVHTFYGAEKIWDNTWDTVDRAVEMILNPKKQNPRKDLIQKGYTLETMLKRFQEVIDE